MFETIINENEIETKLEILAEVNSKDKLFDFLSWLEIKSQYIAKEKIEPLIFAAFKFSDIIDYKPETLSNLDSDFLSMQRFCYKMLRKVPELEDRRKLVNRHISSKEKPYSFSAAYTCNAILRAKDRLDKNELYSDHLWYELFSKDEVDDSAYAKQIKSYLKKIIKYLFEESLKKPELLNGEQIYFVINELSVHQIRYYKKVFPQYLSDDKKLLDILILCITRSYMTSGSVIGFQFAKDQLLEGMDVNEIKKRLENIDETSLTRDQIAAVSFFNHAYKEGFQEKKFYDFYTCKEVGRW